MIFSVPSDMHDGSLHLSQYRLVMLTNILSMFAKSLILGLGPKLPDLFSFESYHLINDVAFLIVNQCNLG